MTTHFEFGLATISEPSLYGKTFRLANGQLVRSTHGEHLHGTLRRVQTDLDGLVAILRDGCPGQHLTAGVPSIAPGAEAPLAAVKLARPGNLTRTAECLPFPAGPGLMVIDADGIGDHLLVREQLAEACEDLGGCAMAITTSSSSNILRTDTGQTLRGAEGLHLMVPVLDATDTPRAMRVLFDRLWLAGHGQVKVSESGQALHRTVVDLALRNPSQPVFLASHCGPGLEQRRERWRVAGPILDTHQALPDLTAQERERLQQLQADAVERMADALADARAAWEERQVAQLVARGVNPDQAREHCRQAADAGDLCADWPLTLADGRQVTVGEVLADKARFHGIPCRDPLEPDYGTRAVAKVFSDQPKPVLRSYAHGERNYYLHAFTSAHLKQASALGQRLIESARAKQSTAQPTQEPAAPRRLQRVDVNFAELKPARWVLKDFIAAGEVVTFAGQPGVGKSTAFASLAIVVAGLGPDIGSNVENDRPRQVAIVSENPAQYARIVHALCSKHRLDPVRVGQLVTLYSTARMRLAEIDREIGAVVREHSDEEPPLLILDTASASFELENENDNAQVSAALARLRPLAEATGAAVWIVAHAAKALSREDSEITPRGAGAWTGDVHGTGSVFRERDRPDAVFVRSLKNRWERGFDEIEVSTSISLHDVADDRGEIQQLRIRTGVPRRAETTQQQRHELRRLGEQAAVNLRAHHWVLATLQAHPHAPTSQAWLEAAAKDAPDMPRSAVRAALSSLQQDGRISLVPIHPRPKAGARERFVLVATPQANALRAA